MSWPLILWENWHGSQLTIWLIVNWSFWLELVINIIFVVILIILSIISWVLHWMNFPIFPFVFELELLFKVIKQPKCGELIDYDLLRGKLDHPMLYIVE